MAKTRTRIAERTTTSGGPSAEPLLIRASAGTGKTYQLTGRLLRLLAEGAAVETILATTFTRKAAGEILSRVLLALARAATDPTGKLIEQLREQTGLPDLTAERATALVHRLLRDIHRLRILTLDSLFSQLARTFGSELGLPPGWRLTDEIEDAWIRERAIDVMLGALQTQEVAALLAMLGKGDTKRSVRREMLAVVNDGYAEARACAPEAWQKLAVPTGPQPEQLAAAAETLRATVIGNKSAEKMFVKIADLADTQQWDQLAELTPITAAYLAALGEPVLYYRKPIPPHGVEALRLIADACATHVLSLLRVQTEATGQVIATYEAQLMAMKRALRAFAFDDLAQGLSAVFSVVTPGQAGHRMDGNIEHVLLDEFQDTSPSQWGVLKPLAVAAARPDSPGSFFCVGDTKQAIYRWRGGVAGIFDAVADQVPGVRQQEQNISFRSSPVVTSVVNEVFRHLTRHPELGNGPDPADHPSDRTAYESAAIARFAATFPEHRSAKPLPGHVTLLSGPGGNSSGASSRNGDNQEDSTARSIRHFSYVAERVTQWSQEMPGRSIGVLTRTNQSVAWLIHLLRRANVDVSQEGGNPLTDSAAVELVLSALMMAEHPGDRRWWFHVAHSPLAEWLQTSPSDETYQAAARVRRLCEDVGVAGAVEQIADHIAPHCDRGDVIRLRQLVTLAQSYELNRQPRLSDFVALVRAKRVERPQPAAVRVMTVHQAKGLEFDVVVLPELGGSLTRQGRQTIAMKDSIDAVPSAMLRYIGSSYWHYLPLRWQRCFGEHAAGLMTESLCLLYVALTRAKHALHMMVPPANKPDYSTKTAAALLYHALGCTADATEPEQTWYEAGDPRWFEA